MVVAVARDRNMPRGMSRSGFRTSSATLATFVSPAYETKTRPTVATNPSVPKAKKGVNWASWTSCTPRAQTSQSPCITKKPRMASRVTTRIFWKPVVSLAPTTLRTVNTPMSPRATGRIGRSTKRIR